VRGKLRRETDQSLHPSNGVKAVAITTLEKNNSGGFRLCAIRVGACGGGEDDIHETDLAELVKDALRFVSWSCTLADLREGLPQHVCQSAGQDVSQHSVFFLVPDRTNSQVTLLNAERQLGLAIRRQLFSPLQTEPFAVTFSKNFHTARMFVGGDFCISYPD
jgi:hypothetical protein